MQITKHMLSQALFDGGRALVTDKGILTSVQSIQREDGSGHCYNVTGYTSHAGKGSMELTTIFIRTID